MSEHIEQTAKQTAKPHDQQDSARLAAQEAGISSRNLWVHYFSVGGNLGPFELEAYVHGLYPLQVGERNLIALALNELIDELPQRRKAQFIDEAPVSLLPPITMAVTEPGTPAGLE